MPEREEPHEDPPAKRRPYERPRVESESVYERGALGCGKMLPPRSFDCAQDPNAS